MKSPHHIRVISMQALKKTVNDLVLLLGAVVAILSSHHLSLVVPLVGDQDQHQRQAVPAGVGFVASFLMDNTSHKKMLIFNNICAIYLQGVSGVCFTPFLWRIFTNTFCIFLYFCIVLSKISTCY